MARAQAAAKSTPKPVPPEPAPAKGATKTGATVTVACKMPNGIVIHAERQKVRHEPVMGGGTRTEKYYERIPGSEVMIFGNARPHGGEYRTRVVGGFALTQGVSKELWDHWLSTHKDLPAVKKGLLFAYPSIGGAADAARERAELRSGLEPLKPDGDPRAPRPTNARIGQITTNDEVTHEFEQVDEEPA